MIEFQIDSETSITKLTSQIELLKNLNTKSVGKCEELSDQIAKLRSRHAQELKEKVAKSAKRSEDVDAEIQVLKEMVKSVKMQVKSKETDI